MLNADHIQRLHTTLESGEWIVENEKAPDCITRVSICISLAAAFTITRNCVTRGVIVTVNVQELEQQRKATGDGLLSTTTSSFRGGSLVPIKSLRNELVDLSVLETYFSICCAFLCQIPHCMILFCRL